MHRELVDRAKRGDEEAFDAFVREVGDRVPPIHLQRPDPCAHDAADRAELEAIIASIRIEP